MLGLIERNRAPSSGDALLSAPTLAGPDATATTYALDAVACTSAKGPVVATSTVGKGPS